MRPSDDHPCLHCHLQQLLKTQGMCQSQACESPPNPCGLCSPTFASARTFILLSQAIQGAAANVGAHSHAGAGHGAAADHHRHPLRHAAVQGALHLNCAIACLPIDRLPAIAVGLAPVCPTPMTRSCGSQRTSPLSSKCTLQHGQGHGTMRSAVCHMTNRHASPLTAPSLYCSKLGNTRES